MEYADILAQRCKRIQLGPGETISRQGERSTSMHFILEGRVAIIVRLGDGRTVRVRSLGQQTIIGEMGLITQRPRSATVEAEVASVVYEFRIEDYERLRSISQR